MSAKYLFPLLLTAALLLAACQPVPTSPENLPSPDVATNQPGIPEDLPPAYPAPADPNNSPTLPLPHPPVPIAVRNALTALAGELQVTPDDIKLVEYQPVDWPDGCLGIKIPDMACTAALVPGYRVILELNGQFYEMRTNMDGSQVALVGAHPPALQPNEPAPLTWESNQEDGCRRAEIGREEITYQPCDGAPTVGYFASQARREQLNRFIDLYAPFNAATPAGEVVFRGSGPVTATPAEQRMLAEWANIVAQEAETGRSDASWGLALDVKRQGSDENQSGSCQHVSIYLTGQALASGCEAEPGQELGILHLTSSQLRQLYQWVDIFQSTEQAENGLTVFLAGQGARAPEDIETDWMAAMADEIYTRLATSQDSEHIQRAFLALEQYLQAGAAGDYDKAAGLYGGGYEGLQSMNPDIPPGDLAALFEAYCKFNGGVCNLGILNVVQKNQLDPQRVRFTVELRAPDGGLFRYGPCCGEDASVSPPQTQFDFTVILTEDGFQVLELPVYVP